MDVDDLVLVSIDDHIVEPADMFERHVPARWKADAPRLVRGDDGKERWIFRERVTGCAGLNAVVSWPREEWSYNPAGMAEMRPGAHDIHERVRDMNRNGILASMCFPSFPGFSGNHLSSAKDELTAVVLQAYNDWHLAEWAGAYPGRFLPLALLPTWDTRLMVEEIRRVAANGFKAVAMPELPYLDGNPSYHDMDHWGPVFGALCDTGLAMCCHIGQGFRAINFAPDAPIDTLLILASQVSVFGAQDLLWGPAMRSFPALRIAFSEGGIGWIPFYLDRCDHHYVNQRWLRREFGGKLPSEVFKEHSLACYVRDPTALRVRDAIGIDTIAWECDYPHSDSIWPDAPEQMVGELRAAGGTDDEIHKIAWENACRFFAWDPFALVPREQATVGALRAQATDVDTTVRSRTEWVKLNTDRMAASAAG
jgi:predicted TIM-barrel fold metal-dependent hydrolase